MPNEPGASSTAAQTKAEVKLANWNGHHAMLRMPATSGTAARSGPKKRPMKIAATPHFSRKASPRGSRSGCRDKGQIFATEVLKVLPNQYETQSPKPAP